jgi:dienelactone hydrolase
MNGDATPIWFGPANRPLFGWLHTPAGGRARAGVVICPPLAHEHQATYATLRFLAEDLAARDLCVLRLDYDGTGDSAGSEEDPDRVASWLRSVREAIGHLRASGVSSVMLVGVRFGALLAALSTDQVPRTDGLVLWDPVTSGRMYLAEQRMLGARSFNTPSSRQDGSVEVPGTTFEPQTVADIRALDLTRGHGRLADRVLVVSRPDQGLAALRSRLASTDVEWVEAPRQADLMEKGWSAGIVANETNKTVGDWLCRLAPSETAPLSPPGTITGAAVGSAADGTPIVETPMHLGHTGLFGILTEPAATMSTTTAIFLNVANGPRIGPCRLWVEWARRWAAAGVRCFRMDLSGIGDSPLRHPTQPWLTLRAPEHFDDVAEACAQLSPHDPSDVILVGLCTSGYQALDSAMAIKPRAVVALNPITYFRQPERVLGLRSDPRRRIALYRKLNTYDDRTRAQRSDFQPLSGTGPVRAYTRFDRWLHSADAPRLRAARLFREFFRVVRTGLSWHLQVLAAPDKRPSRWLTELVVNEVDVLLVCSKRDARMILFGLPQRTLRKLTRTQHFRFECISDLEHSEFISDRRAALGEMVGAQVLSRFRPHAAPTTQELDRLSAVRTG